VQLSEGLDYKYLYSLVKLYLLFKGVGNQLTDNFRFVVKQC